MENNFKDFSLIETLRKEGIEVTLEQEQLFLKQIEKDFNYIPMVGVFGKTGAGKSSLVNAIYGQDLCEVSDVEACTTEMKEANAGGIILVDCPGIAESKEKDAIYMRKYHEYIPKLDVIFWVLKGDERAYQPDIEFYKTIKDTVKCPIFFVVNQVDKIEPYREWNIEGHCPGSTQSKHIDDRINYVACSFDVAPADVIPVSANERYNLMYLVNNMLARLDPVKALKQVEVLPTTYTEDEQAADTIKEKTEEYVESRLEKIGFAVANWGQNKGPIIRAITGAFGGFLSSIGRRRNRQQ